MNINQTSQILAARKQSFLDIGSYEGGQKRIVFKKYNADNSNWKKLIEEVFAGGANKIFIDIYAPNGSSYKFVRSVTLTNDGFSFQPTLAMPGAGAPQAAMPDQFTAYIIREKDEKIRDKEERISELKDQNRIDQDTIRELREKNWQLEKDNKFMEKEFELKRVEENLERESIVEKVIGNEQLMGLAQSFLMAKVQQSQAPDASGLSGIENDPNISQGKKQIIKEVGQWLKMQNDAMASKIYAIFSQLSMNPKMIDKTINDLTNNNNNGPVQEANTY